MDASIPSSSSSKREADPVTGDERDAKKLKTDEEEKEETEEEKEEREFKEACDQIRAKYTDETEIAKEIKRYRLDHLNAQARAAVTDEELKEMHLDRDELKLSRYERSKLFLERDLSSDGEDEDDGDYPPEYGPDDELPEGYCWASMDPCTHPDLKDVVIRKICARCLGFGHLAKDCTSASSFTGASSW